MSVTLVTLLAAAISGVVSIAVAVVSNLPIKRREREADWSKVNLEYYRDYVSAAAGMVEGRAIAESHVRYTDAFNNLALAESPAVPDAVKAYQDEVSIKNTVCRNHGHDELYSNLINALRLDLTPSRLRKGEAQSFCMITTRPDMRPNVPTSK